MDCDVVIIGGGPAGVASAIYCKRANLNVIVLDKYVIGGNLNNYLEIENYPGMGRIVTPSLVDNFLSHIDYLNIPYAEFADITEIDTENNIVQTEECDYNYKYLIIATGSKPRMLGVPGEEENIGKGVHYCAICDGALYKDKVVAVVGGGNSACEEALGLSKICKKVFVIEFTNKLNAEQTTVDKIYSTENIEVHVNCQVKAILNADKGLAIKTNSGEFLADGVFPYIGMSPNVPKGLNVEVDTHGFIKVNEDMRTSINNIFAIGDVTSKKYRQVVTAMADGAIAGIAISKEV